jgi:hypothetical protein
MRFFYILIFLLSTAPFLVSQTLDITPVEGNHFLKRYASKEDLKNAAVAQHLTGVNPLDLVKMRGDDCPPVFSGNIVESGSSIEIEVDTFFLGQDTAATLSLLDFKPLQFGKATLPDTSIVITYEANPGLIGAGVDTIWVLFSEPSDQDTIIVVVNVKRQGKALVLETQTVAPESISTYSFEDELNFPGKAACSEFADCADNYDGKGHQLFHFTNYQTADANVVYYASRFPGTDTVCVRICDELTVCDTFKIPFLVVGDTIKKLPFFDDFSYRGPYPTAANWLDKQVYVNNTLAKDPPSVGLITFDGLDRRGDPYNNTAGVGDRLTSKAIDLSGLTANDNVVLRFFVAPKGYGLEPEVADSLVLEFRNQQRQWVRMDTYKGFSQSVLIDSVPPFGFKAYAIDNPAFLHKAFQFRFVARTSPGGVVDLWHVDYVHLDKNSSVNNFFTDVAFTRLPNSVLKTYTSMPWRHFKGFEVKELKFDFLSAFFNHFNFPQEIENSDVSIKETVTNVTFNQAFTLVDNFSIDGTSPKQGSKPIPDGNPLRTPLTDFFKNIPPGDNRNVQVNYDLTVVTQDTTFRRNDQVVSQTPFGNYFAHDDGTAEWQVFIRFAAGGEQMATKYQTNVDDSLRAVQFLFPHVNGNVQNQKFNLRIWLDSLQTTPIYEQELLKPFYANNVLDTLDGFTTYRLEDPSGNEAPVFIPGGRDFYVGFQQVTATQLGIPLGFDVQNPCDCNHINLSGTWKKFPSNAKGALMVRPVFGDKAPKNTTDNTTEVLPASAVVDIFPNPTSGELRFLLKKGNLDDYNVMIFNQVGELVFRQLLVSRLNLGDFPSGTYYLQLVDEKTGGVFSQKILVQK